MEFKEYSIDEIGEVVGGGTPSTKIEDYYNGDISWITPKDLSGYNKMYISKGARNITELGLSKSSAKLLPKDSVLLTSRAPIGYVALAGKELCTNQGFKSIVCNREYILPGYLYYYLKKSKDLLESIATGSTFKEVSGKAVKNFQIKIPDVKSQRIILEILSNIDKKIENNTEIICNLEQISQTLFKRWFIDFEFPNEEGQPYKSSGGKMVESELGEIPEGWEIKKLGTIVSNKREKYKKEEKLPYVPINELPMKKMLFYNFLPAEQAKSSLIKFNKNDILIGNMRVYFHRVCLAPFEGVTRTTTFVLKPLTSLFRNYILLNLFTEKFVDFANQTSKGTTIPYAVWENGCENFKVIFPNDESILKKFNDVVDETILKSLLLLEEIDKLEQLRDTLLPKLLSGEIEIPDDLEV